MTRGGHLTKHFECTRGIAFNVSDRDKENHDSVSGLFGAGSCGPADDALKVRAFKVPTSTVGGPDLCFESILGIERRELFQPFLH